jgi:hypothetical protein
MIRHRARGAGPGDGGLSSGTGPRPMKNHRREQARGSPGPRPPRRCRHPDSARSPGEAASGKSLMEFYDGGWFCVIWPCLPRGSCDHLSLQILVSSVFIPCLIYFMQEHKQELPYKCLYCTLRFRHKRGRERHMKQHTEGTFYTHRLDRLVLCIPSMHLFDCFPMMIC